MDCRVRFVACGDFGGLIAPVVGFAGTPLVVVAGCVGVLLVEPGSETRTRCDQKLEEA